MKCLYPECIDACERCLAMEEECLPNTNKRKDTWTSRKFLSQLRKWRLKQRKKIVGQKHNMFKEWRKEDDTLIGPKG